MTKEHFEEEDFLPSRRKEERAEKKMASAKDRSKFKKTDSEKRKRLLEEETRQRLSKKTLLRGRVLAISPDGITAQHGEDLYHCVLKGALKKEKGRMKNLLTVGDFVLFEAEGGKGGVIAFVEERTSVLSRKEHLHRRSEQLLAANIDQVLITVSICEPGLKPALVDRYIIAARKGNMEPVIVVNKIDLVEKGSFEDLFLQEFVATYTALGIPVITMSAAAGLGMEALKKQMTGKASVFSGQSGVGKSSLINAITGLDIATQEIVKKTQKGSHTTTTAHLIPLEFGGWCIDTPGIRSFGLWDLQREDLEDYFPEISEVGQGCKFLNCTHTHEPSCAVQKAAESGMLSELRFESYCKLMEEIE